MDENAGTGADGKKRVDAPFELVVQPQSVLTPNSPREGKAADQAKLTAGKTIEGAAKLFAESCLGKESAYPNNCAHYLSDALIRAGYADLSGSRCVSASGRCGAPNCTSGGRRAIKAKELRCWFDEQSPNPPTSTVQRRTGFYAVYQERQRDGQGHVVILDSDAWIFYGTGWFEAGQPEPNRWIHEYYKW